METMTEREVIYAALRDMIEQQGIDVLMSELATVLEDVAQDARAVSDIVMQADAVKWLRKI